MHYSTCHFDITSIVPSISTNTSFHNPAKTEALVDSVDTNYSVTLHHSELNCEDLGDKE